MRTATIGKILGALGLVLLLTSPFTYFFTTGQGTIAAAKALVGLGLIAAFFITNYKNLGQFASGKSTFFFVSSALMALLVLGALVAVNYIAVKKDKTWDLTNKKIYTLAPQTTSTLQGLKDKVRAIGFLEPSHPAYEATEHLFARYQREAPEKFEYVFKDPRKNPELASKYQLKQGQATVVLTRGDGDKESHTVLKAVSEQELTNALIKLNAVGEQRVYFTAGHGEWPLQPTQSMPGMPSDSAASLSELRKDLLQEGYSPEALNLAGQEELPKDAALVVVAGPRIPFSAPEVKALRKYLEEGGRLLLFVEPNFNLGPELTQLLADHGFQLDPGVIADDKFAISSPYMIVSIFYGNHDITRLLKSAQLNVQFPTARGISVLREGLLPDVKVEPVVTTSPYAWEESTPDDNPSRSSGEKTGQIPIVAASTRATGGAAHKRFDEARVVVFGDSELLTDTHWGHEANRNLVMNGFGWASTQVSKITIRPPDRDISTLDLDPDMMSKIRFVSSDLLPLSLLGVGLAIWLSRRDK